MKSATINISEKIFVYKSKLVIFSILVLAVGTTSAQYRTPAQAVPVAPQNAEAAPAVPVAKPTRPKSKVTLNFEDEFIKGNYDAPDILLMNSRKHIKYKDLFNTRNHFIDEIESNRGLFNAHRK